MVDPLDPFDQVALEKNFYDNLEKMRKTTDNIYSILFSFFKITLIILVLVLVYRMMSYQNESTIVLPRENGLDANFLGATLADRLQFELKKINGINERPLIFSNPPANSTKNNFSLYDMKSYDYSYEIHSIHCQAFSPNKIYYDPGTMSVGGFSLDPAKTLFFLQDLFGNRKSLTVEIQRFGSTISILATLYDPDPYRIKTWEESRTLSQDGANQSAEDLIPNLAETLAFRIATDTIKGGEPPKTWQAFENLTKGREAYIRYNTTNNIEDLDIASNMTLHAIHLEPSCTESINLSKGLGSVYAEKANALARQYDPAKYGEARQYYDKAVKLNPEDAIAWGNKGYVCFYLNRSNEALQSCNNAIDLDNKSAPAWGLRGYILIHQRYIQPEEALFSLDQAIKLKNDTAWYWNEKGNALFYLGECENDLNAKNKLYQDALDAKNVSIKLDPTSYFTYNDMANVLEALGRTKESRAALSKASAP